MARNPTLLLNLLLGALLLAGCGAPTRVVSAGAPLDQPGALAAKTPGAYKVGQSFPSSHWAKLELLTSTYAKFPVEHARPNGRQADPELVEAFGTEMPASRDVVLAYGKGWEKGKGTPVLLVHGAILDATSVWITPHGYDGLAKTLTAQGLRVFAVSFAHHHGDNMLWAEQINNAIARIKAVTGAQQVDVVSHSKGTVAARALASGVRQSWMQPYRGDIRRMLMMGGPHLGLDFTFRHPLVNLGLYPERSETLFNAPMSWTRMLVMGVWVDTGAQTFMKGDGDYFPGQAQMLYRWDKTYPLPTLEQDWYTTYYGGQGFISQSPGIDKAIAAGGHFIDQLRAHPLDKRLELSVLAGNQPTMKNVLNETSGPSDGVVFLKSATETDDMTRDGAKLVDKTVLPLNHMELLYASEAKAWVLKQLKRP